MNYDPDYMSFKRAYEIAAEPDRHPPAVLVSARTKLESTTSRYAKLRLDRAIKLAEETEH